LGRGSGGGRGYRNRFCATGVSLQAYGPEPEAFLGAQEEAALLRNEAERLRSALESIEQRLEKLETT
jgi:ubiquinone biosynthesis protein UbiJ